MLITSLIAILISCVDTKQKFVIDDAYMERFEKETNGGFANNRRYYLQLVGLFELNPLTPNRFGSAPGNEHILDMDGIPEVVGSIEVNGDSLIFRASTDIEVKTEADSIITDFIIEFKENGYSTDLFHERLSWRMMSLEGNIYLRIRDLENPVLKEFKGYKRYDLTAEYIFEGQFTPYEKPEIVMVPTELGVDRSTIFVGTISFTYQGLQVDLKVGDGFIMFSDETSGDQTYGSGRYLTFSKPSEDGSVIVDFNYAYNPPCEFSKFTTCLFPPKQNRLPFKVTAGETTERL